MKQLLIKLGILKPQAVRQPGSKTHDGRGGHPHLIPLTGDDHRDLAFIFARRDCTQPTTKQLDDGLFRNAVDKVGTVVRHFRPSGSNRTEGVMDRQITVSLATLGLTQDAYWAEVWRRGGRKACDDYNEARKDRQAQKQANAARDAQAAKEAAQPV